MLLPKKIPTKPGIYLFYNSQNKLIYVGKATNLRSRVRSYFNAGKKDSRPIEQMMFQVKDVKWRVADSVLEAIILESIYIKKYQPKYNVIGKDNKSWNYIVITTDKYPRVETLRQHDLDLLTTKERKKRFKYLFGPYPGLQVKTTMKLLFRLFSISSCRPDQKRECLYRQMGQCLGVCVGEIGAREYTQKAIKPLVMFLKADKKRLIRDLTRKMKLASDKLEYEEAARLLGQIKALQRIQDATLITKSFFQGIQIKKESIRIEGYDISNLGSSGIVGAMVVFEQGEPKKNDYRKFTIRGLKRQSDVHALAEMLERRLKHREWPLPDVFLIDGGVPQVNIARQVISGAGLHVPVIGIAKGAKRKKNEFIFDRRQKKLTAWIKSNQILLINVRDEAHRFAITYQRQKRKI